MRKLHLPILLLIGVVLLSAFNNGNGFKQTASGLQYKIFKSKTSGQAVNNGDVVNFNLAYYTDKDSLLQRNDGIETMVFLDTAMDKAQLMSALCMLSQGDSAVFRISTDKLFNTGDPRPDYFASGRYLVYSIKVNSVQSMAQIENEEKVRYTKLKKEEDGVIEAYAMTNDLKLTTTPSGLRYQIIEPVKGALQVKSGDTVTVHYTGTLIDGKKFDSSRDRNQPITFQVDQKMVISGWDEGIMLLKKGEKAIFVIPSELGYGRRAMGPIPANSILVFDIEIVDIKPKK